MKNIIPDISGLFLTKSLKIDQDFGQVFSPLFTVKNQNGYYQISAIESFAVEGDFMHYNTDLILERNINTGEMYVASEDKYYKILVNDLDKKNIIDALLNLDNKDLKYEGNICKDVIIKLENTSTNGMTDFIFLIANNNSLDKSNYSNSEFSLYYYLASYDTNSKSIYNIRPVNLCNFVGVIENGL